MGIVFNPEETNSRIILRMFKEACQKRGLSAVEVKISGPANIQQSVVSLLGKVDALYAPTDATLQSNFDALMKVADQNRIPVFNCDESTVQKGAVFSVGFNYSDLGRLSGEMAADILTSKAKPESMPIRLSDRSVLFYNGRKLGELGLGLPDKWVTQGKDLSGK